MEKGFEDFFNQYFDQQSNMPNPLNNEAFAQFISDQIKNAVPTSHPNGSGFEQAGPADFADPGQHNPQYRRNRPNPDQGGDWVPSHPSMNAQSPNQNIKYNVFETHDFVIARIAMPNPSPDQKKSILLNSHELFLKEEGRNEPFVQIKLPKPVNSKKTKTKIKNGILEVQMVKRPPEPLSEFEITELFEDYEN